MNLFKPKHRLKLFFIVIALLSIIWTAGVSLHAYCLYAHSSGSIDVWVVQAIEMSGKVFSAFTSVTLFVLFVILIKEFINDEI